MWIVAIMVAGALAGGLIVWQRGKVAGLPAGDGEAEGQRLIAATQARYRQQLRDQPDLGQWAQDDVHAAYIFDPDEPAYKAEFERRGLMP